MKTLLLLCAFGIALGVSSCGQSTNQSAGDQVVTPTQAAEADQLDVPTQAVDDDLVAAPTQAPEATAAEATTASVGTDVADVAALFDDGALTSEVATVACTLETGTETTCYQFEVASLADTVDTTGPYCPETVDDVGGIWVWDGEQSGLYRLDSAYWAMMSEQGFDFVDDEGNVSITDPAAQGGPGTVETRNSCLEASPDGSFHIQVLIPTTPENLDEATDLSSISRIGLALDGVTIFGDAPSVADRGGLPALDACGGHIDPSGYYHWHFGAESIQTNLDEAGADVHCDVEQDAEALVGFAYDGYAIYGPEEDHAVPTDLDACSGHVSTTDELGETYHYHLTYDSPNLPVCRVGATATEALSSPDNDAASLPNGTAQRGGGPGGPEGAGPGPGGQDGQGPGPGGPEGAGPGPGGQDGQGPGPGGPQGEGPGGQDGQGPGDPAQSGAGQPAEDPNS